MKVILRIELSILLPCSQPAALSMVMVGWVLDHVLIAAADYANSEVLFPIAPKQV
jgi:hypothetical protein